MQGDKWSKSIRSQIKAQREFGQRGAHWDNYAIAQNVLHEEIEDGIGYGLSRDQLDRLLAHARQDAAHALCNTKSLLEGERSTRWKLRIIFVLQIVIIYMLAR